MEGLLRGLGAAGSMRGSQVGKGPLAGERQDGAAERFEWDVAGG